MSSTFVLTKYFDHPIYHPCSQLFSDQMFFQKLSFTEPFFQLQIELQYILSSSFIQLLIHDPSLVIQQHLRLQLLFVYRLFDFLVDFFSGDVRLILLVWIFDIMIIEIVFFLVMVAMMFLAVQFRWWVLLGLEFELFFLLCWFVDMVDSDIIGGVCIFGMVVFPLFQYFHLIR